LTSSSPAPRAGPQQATFGFKVLGATKRPPGGGGGGSEGEAAAAEAAAAAAGPEVFYEVE
jgi:hypothetical protein